MKPLLIDLYCGLFGWGEGFVSEGWRVIGFDIIQRGPIPPGCKLILQDCRTIDGYRLSRANLIVASPPCDDFSRWDQPWPNVVKNRKDPDLSLWRAAERIAAEAGRPLIIENVRGAQKFMGTARNHFGKQYLWGDVPPILPYTDGLQNEGRQKQTLSSARKAERAKIPLILARHIANWYRPGTANV